MASNIQRGPRRMDAGDWIRIKRLQGGRTYLTKQVSDADMINPPPRLETGTNRNVYTEFGTSKIRRPASNYTDYVASQTVDYILESGGPGPVNKRLVAHKLCTCVTTDPVKHNGLCVKCQYDPIVVRK